MLQSRVLKSFLVVLSCTAFLVAAQEVGEQQAIDGPTIGAERQQEVPINLSNPSLTPSLVVPTPPESSSVVSGSSESIPSVDSSTSDSVFSSAPSTVDASSSTLSSLSPPASDHVATSALDSDSSSNSVSSPTSIESTSSSVDLISNPQVVQTSTSSVITSTSSASTQSPTAPIEFTSPTSIASSTTKPIKLDQREDLPTTAATACGNANNTGLHNLIRQARQLLPLERLRNILVTAVVNDTAVQNLRTLLSSDDFRAKVTRLHAVSEYAALNKFTCEKLQLDYGLYIEFVRLIMNIRLNVDASVPNTPFVNPRPGVRGLLQDLREALPRNQLRAMNRRLLFTDRDLITAMRHIVSSQFRRTLRAYRQRTEYREVFDALEKAGASARPIQQLIATAVGWSNMLDIGAETTIINI